MSRPRPIAGFGRAPTRTPSPPDDVPPEIQALADRLAEPEGEVGRAIQFVSARAGEGTSSVARAFARAAASRGGRGVWLVELDVLSGAQVHAFEGGRHGRLGEAAPASPDGSAFFHVEPAALDGHGRDIPDAAYLACHPVGEDGLWVTRFRREALKPRQTVRITASGDYWAALRRHADLVVVDAPAAETSRAAAAVAPHMDATVIVVAADNDDPAGPALLRAGIKAVGGRCAGAVLNRAPRPAPRLLRALTP